MNAGTKENGTTLVTASDRFCANGETSARKSVAIPCQATEDFGSVEGVETRWVSSNNTPAQERPAPQQFEGDDIVRHSSESRRACLNSTCNRCIYGAIKMYTPAKNMIFSNVGRAAGSIA